jgi:glycine oxidase
LAVVQGPSITVAGAGALGLASALALARAGCRVTVCEPADPFAAAIPEAPVFEAVLDEVAASHFDILMAARDLWPGFAAGAGVELDRSGALAVGSTAWTTNLAAGMARLNIPPRELSASGARDLAPGLASDIGGGLFTSDDWRIDPRQAITALRRAARSAGVVFQTRAIAPGHHGDLLVRAVGAAQPAPIIPIKGQLARLAQAGLTSITLRAEGVYAVPGPCGLTLGATMESGAADAAVDPVKVQPLLAAGRRLLPALDTARAQLFAGVRAATPDGLPLVGFRGEALLAVGARRNGWLLAPLIGAMVAAYATGGDPGPYAARFDPARFDR